MKEIIFKINEEGEISMEVKGAQGADCDALTGPFEATLGTISSKERKAEFYQEVGETTDVTGEGYGG